MTWPERHHTLPDGRELSAARDDGVWVVALGERTARSREIHDALVELLQPPGRQWPDWFKAAADDLAARDTPLGRRYACPCCGYLTLEETPVGTYDICPVCYWEDDAVQFRDPSYRGGANTASLDEARASFHAIGVSEPRFKENVRAPLPEERP